MAQLLGNNVQILVNNVDLSNRIDQIQLQEVYADIDTTTFGNTSRRRIAGLGDNKLTLEFQQDFANGSVEQTVAPLVGTIVAVEIKPINAATSTTNPAYEFNAVIEDWKPIDVKVGEILKASVTWPIDGAVTKAYS